MGVAAADAAVPAASEAAATAAANAAAPSAADTDVPAAAEAAVPAAVTAAEGDGGMQRMEVDPISGRKQKGQRAQKKATKVKVAITHVEAAQDRMAAAAKEKCEHRGS